MKSFIFLDPLFPSSDHRKHPTNTILPILGKRRQLQAFHVFKIFVANPQRPIRVHTILYKNKAEKKDSEVVGFSYEEMRCTF